MESNLSSMLADKSLENSDRMSARELPYLPQQPLPGQIYYFTSGIVLTKEYFDSDYPSPWAGQESKKHEQPLQPGSNQENTQLSPSVKAAINCRRRAAMEKQEAKKALVISRQATSAGRRTRTSQGRLMKNPPIKPALELKLKPNAGCVVVSWYVL